MIDKQQLAAMGAHLAEQQQPMCLQKRVEQLEAEVRLMAGLLRNARVLVSEAMQFFTDHPDCYNVEEIGKLTGRISDAIAGKITAVVAPEGWSLVPDMPTPEMCAAFHKSDADWEDGWAFDDNGNRHNSPVYQWVAMLSAAPSPDYAK